MNTYELVTQTMRQCRMDPTDTSDRAEHEDWMVGAFNEAYKKICREKVNLWVQEAVTLDSAKCFTLASLAETVVEIKRVTKYRDYSEDAGYREAQPFAWDLYNKTTVIVPAATASGTMYVKYTYLPDALVVVSTEPDGTFVADDTNTPVIDEALHPILTYWATAQYYLSKGANYIGMVNLWIGMYDRAMGEIEDSVGEPQKITGAYRPWIG